MGLQCGRAEIAVGSIGKVRVWQLPLHVIDMESFDILQSGVGKARDHSGNRVLRTAVR